jgi:16S rRNA (guanine1207-N2)-methyltransferase
MPVTDPRAARLAMALGEGGLHLPKDGQIAVFGPRAGEDLSALPKQRVVVIQGFRPDHDAFAGAGWHTLPQLDGRYAAALICLPRNRAEAQDLIARAVAASDGPVIVDGQKTDGIDAILRACRQRAVVSEPMTKGHGKLFWMTGPGASAFADWTVEPRRLPNGFVTLPGVFSADGVDPGSELLAAALPAQMSARVADLGAGWGWLAAQVLRRDGVQEVHLVEASHAALACARANIQDPRARFHWADATRFRPEAPFDAVVMNPPFHTGRAGDPRLGARFIAAAARMLTPQGTLWMVANRHLPYETALAESFRENTEMPGSAAFKLYRARAPRREAARKFG